MKELRSYNSSTEAHFIAGLLRTRGIPCEVRDNPVSEEPPFAPSIWILNDAHLGAATEVLKEKRSAAGWPWSCSRCASENEPQFNACWSCGAERSPSR